METKHTPGPWLIASESGTFVYALNDAGSNRFWLNVSAAGPGRAEKAECEANARLIAAAPDLLAALQGIDARGMTQATWARAARAISKAITPAAQESEP